MHRLNFHCGFSRSSVRPDCIAERKRYDGERMRGRVLVVALCMVSLLAATGCLGRFASNQGRRQAARSSDHYVRKYVEPEIDRKYADDPEGKAKAKKKLKQDRNNMADTIVRTGNERQVNPVGVNDRGWLTEER